MCNNNNNVVVVVVVVVDVVVVVLVVLKNPIPSQINIFENNGLKTKMCGGAKPVLRFVLGMDEMEFSEASSNVYDIIAEYEQWSEAGVDEGEGEEEGYEENYDEN